MNNFEFVEKLKDVANKHKTLYVHGCFGAPMNNKNKTRYCLNTDFNKKPERTNKIRAASADTFGFDCVCLGKGVLWGWSGDKTKTYGGAVYKSNNVPDINADAMIEQCTDVSTDFSKIEVGEAVWIKGHIGWYIGSGMAIECTYRWKDGVQVTAVHNIGKRTGYNGRKWTKHGKMPWITYEKTTVSSTTSSSSASKKSIDEIAQECIDGKWGVGAVRKSKLTKAGYDYATVQARVNELVNGGKKSIDAIAKEVIAGKWGVGAARKSKLTKAGYDYATVQARVNELVKK